MAAESADKTQWLKAYSQMFRWIKDLKKGQGTAVLLLMQGVMEAI